ncbi:hypothetical protein GNZ12_12540 [Paraburkholderia sp. 1N]|uniref:Uncharacterized protein n=1 Tax=Paraburkholderia solitsugae TaxID=2675748 RepID=A0ABX2BPZ5_9BURK|nr:hypothetical protein [Paraburkholderia solitsugae]NPT42130.1 hypothetical protein [Paraburkholderia solitsugae]
MTTTLYRVPVPYGEDTIEVYGEMDMGWYEWRVVTPTGVTRRDTKNRGYGCAEIALRDALTEA